MKGKISKFFKFIKHWLGWAMHHGPESSLFIIIISIIFFDVSYLINIKIETQALFWTFSAIAQGFVGLLAFLGMLGIFRLQVLKQEFIQLIGNGRFPSDGGVLIDTNNLTVGEIVSKCEEIKSGKYSIVNLDASEKQKIEQICRNTNRNQKERQQIRSEIIKFITFPTITIFLSLLFLPFANILGILGFSVLILVLLFSLYSLLIASFYVRVLL